MENFEEVKIKSTGFIQHIFNFDERTKKELINITQYSLLSIIPIILLNKTVQKLIPEADEEKGSVEILGEVAVQVLILFFGVYFIHRVISYLPSYSGDTYGPINMYNFVLPFLIIVLSFQTKLGEKVNILVERVMEMWFGYDMRSQGSNSQSIERERNVVRVSQPISGGRMINQGQQQNQQPQQSQLQQVNQEVNYNTIQGQSSTQINELPSYDMRQQPSLGGNSGNNNNNQPNFDAMYQEPMQGTGMNNNGGGELMAANDALGGFGGSLF